MKIQVYTSITNNHDPMRDDIPVFTEWEHIGSPLAAARFYKTCPHLLFPEADWTIWIDGNVFLNVEPKELIEKIYEGYTEKWWAPNYGVFSHFHRNTVLEEVEAVINGRYDNEVNVKKALLFYNDMFVTHSLDSLAMTMILVRKNNPIINERNAKWWQAMCYSSFRDQLTFPFYFPGPYWPSVDFTQPNKYFSRIA